MPDTNENPLTCPDCDFMAFQHHIRNSVDIAVSPYSEINGRRDCGVSWLGHAVRIQDPYLGDFCEIITEPEDIDPYSFRTLFWVGPPLGQSYAGEDEYDDLFFDPNGNWHFLTTYIATNCKANFNIWNGPEDYPYDNLQTDPSSHDWNSGLFCQGAWDTRLRNPNLEFSGADNAVAQVNEHAAFPDGRYAVEVSAWGIAVLGELPQTHDELTGETTILLPQNDIERPPAGVRGIIVDNYVPHVDSIIVYRKQVGIPGYSEIFSAGWSTDQEFVPPLQDQRYIDGFRYPDRVHNASSAWYYPFDLVGGTGTEVIGVAVKYSEPMQSLENVWFTGEANGQVLWNDGILEPIEEISSEIIDDLEIELEKFRDGSYWVCYESGTAFPIEYVGKLKIHIGNAVLFGFPQMDLAYHCIDANPETVATRCPDNYYLNNWPDGISGYESEDDITHWWGVPNLWYDPSPAPYNPHCGLYFNGYCRYSYWGKRIVVDEVYKVDDLNLPYEPGWNYDTPGHSTGLETEYNRDWCPYTGGFWIRPYRTSSGGQLYNENVYLAVKTSSGWASLCQSMEFEYPASDYDTGHQLAGLRTPEGEDQERYLPFSAISDVWSTQSGNFCWVIWDDNHENESVDSHVSCWSAELNLVETMDYDGHTLHYGCDPEVGVPAGDALPIKIDPYTPYQTFEVLNPTDPEFFPEDRFPVRNPISEDGCLTTSLETRPAIAAIEFIENPVSGSSISLGLSSASQQLIEIQIYDVSGRLVRSAHIDINSGQNSYQIDVSRIPVGIYICTVKSAEAIEVFKVTVLR